VLGAAAERSRANLVDLGLGLKARRVREHKQSDDLVDYVHRGHVMVLPPGGPVHTPINGIHLRLLGGLPHLRDHGLLHPLLHGHLHDFVEDLLLHLHGLLDDLVDVLHLRGVDELLLHTDLRDHGLLHPLLHGHLHDFVEDLLLHLHGLLDDLVDVLHLRGVDELRLHLQLLLQIRNSAQQCAHCSVQPVRFSSHGATRGGEETMCLTGYL